MSSAPGKCEINRVMDHLWAIRAMGENPSHEQWEAILSWAEPLANRTWLDGAVSRKAAEMALSLAMCALGDAYRELGRPDAAAVAYRRAITFNPEAPCTDYYVKLVLEHDLADFYSHAASSLHAKSDLWNQRPLPSRAFANAVTLLAHPRTFFYYWCDVASRNRRLRELIRRAKEADR